MSKLGPISHFPSLVSCDLLVLQGLRCEWGAGVLNLVLSLSHSLILVTGSSTWHLMAKNSLRIWKRKGIVAPHKDGLAIRRLPTPWNWAAARWPIWWFNRTGSTRNMPRHGRPKKLSAHTRCHIQRLSLENRHISAASIAAEFEEVGGQPVSAQTIQRKLHQIGLHGCRPRRKPLLKMIRKKCRKQSAEDKQTKDMDMSCGLMRPR